MKAFYTLLALLCGEFTGHRWIPLANASYAELWFFCDLRLNKRLNKLSQGWWFKAISRSLWRHRNVRNDNVTFSDSLCNLYIKLCEDSVGGGWQFLCVNWNILYALHHKHSTSMRQERDSYYAIIYCVTIVQDHYCHNKNVFFFQGNRRKYRKIDLSG